MPNKIFVGGVPITCTEEQFKAYFEPYGAISKVELHALRGFGYITYESVEAVDSCLEKYEEHYLCKKWVEVKRSIPRELIDAYEREQRRLHALQSAATGGTSAVSAASPVANNHIPGAAPAGGAAAPPAAPQGPNWGALPSAPRKGSGPPTQPPAAATPAASGSAGGAAAKDSGAGWGASRDTASRNPGNLSRIAKLREMGFSDEVAKRVLADCAWDVNKAIDQLLASGGVMTETSGDVQLAGIEEAPEEADLVPVRTCASSSVTPPEQPPEHVDEVPSPGHGLAASSQAPEPGSRRNASPSDGQATPNVVSAAHAESLDGTKADASSAEPPAPVVPKRLERATKAWSGDDPSQLSVTEGEFVNVWIETGTENGWIHAEGCGRNNKVGWLPVCVLKTLPEGQRWMQALQKWEANDDSQAIIAEGSMAIVWVGSKTPEGWTYAEPLQEEGSAGRPGWMPSFCLAWNEN